MPAPFFIRCNEQRCKPVITSLGILIRPSNFLMTMAPRRKPASGTAREVASHTTDYSASGESQYSRGAAHSTVRLRLSGYVPTTRRVIHSAN